MKLASLIECTACMACVDSCNHKALSVAIDRYGFFMIKQDNGKCVDCGLCSKICPVLKPLGTNKKEINLSEPYAAWSQDNDIRVMAASGGAFASLAKLFLMKDAVVYGASIDKFEIKHKRVDTLKDLPMILGSKYQHSDMRGIYKQIRKDLQDGKLVFYGGLSCQVAGVLKYVGNKFLKNLYTVDTICGGISTMLPMLHLKESGNYNGIVSFRDKENGWKSKGFKYALKMKGVKGDIINLGMDNLVLKCFNHIATKRSSCLDCKFNGFHRDSDCTIGDFWGDEKYVEQHKEGLSVIITHSQRIKKFIEESSLQVKLIEWTAFIKNNPCYYWSHHPYVKHYITRARLLNSLRQNNDEKVLKLLDSSSIIKRIEAKITYKRNEVERHALLSEILKDFEL